MKPMGSGLFRIVHHGKPLFHAWQNSRRGQKGGESLGASSGMTLIELAIVLAIVGLITGALVPLARTYFQDRIRNQVGARLDEVQTALLSYLDAYQALPCPDTNNDGQPDCGSGAGNVLYGTLPFAVLGVPPNDGTARPVYYAVRTQFTEHSSVTDTLRSQRCEAMAALPSGILVVQDNGQNVDVPFITLSGGAENRDGAGDQRDGENSDTNGVYERKPPNDTFDDLLEYAGPFALSRSLCGTLVVSNQSGGTYLLTLNVDQGFGGGGFLNISQAPEGASTPLLFLERGSKVRVVVSGGGPTLDQVLFGGGAMRLDYH